MKNSNKSMSYIVEPVRIVVAGAPIPVLPPAGTTAKNGNYAEAIKASGIKGITTGVTSVEAAIGHRDELVANFQKRLKRGDPTAAQELLERYPEMADDKDLRSLITRWIESGRMRRVKGRPKNTYKIHPLWVIGVVNELVSSNAVASKEAAFCWLDENGVLPYESAKDSYYTAQHDPRFKAFLVKVGLPVSGA